MEKQPRPYTFHTTATIAFIRQHYGRLTMPEIAAELGMPHEQLRNLARRQGIKKQWVRE